MQQTCSALGQHLLPARAHAASWVERAPRAALRLLLHCSRAQPALAAALATDGALLRDPNPYPNPNPNPSPSPNPNPYPNPNPN